MTNHYNPIEDERQKNRSDSKKMLEEAHRLARVHNRLGEMVKVVIPNGFLMTTCPEKFLESDITILNREELVELINKKKK